jgi:hypothetical protein
MEPDLAELGPYLRWTFGHLIAASVILHLDGTELHLMYVESHSDATFWSRQNLP